MWKDVTYCFVYEHTDGSCVSSMFVAVSFSVTK